MAARSKKDTTTRARLQSVIKECRDTMRKDAGLNGELDRLPQLSWLLFLRAFDELEEVREIQDAGYRRIIVEQYRWSTWASEQGLTGPQFLDFVNNDLLPYLAGLQGTGEPGDPRDTLGQIFSEVSNRMLSGYLLKELVLKLDSIHFTSADDVHTMAVLYESMLKEMRDAAGDSGEFYTPRPLIRFMVEMTDPRLGEIVMDPAVGTAGFLVEAYEHLMKEARQGSAHDVERVAPSLRGTEKKPMPFLLAQMNMLLHRIDDPQITRGNSLEHTVAEMRRPAAQADVILTNPPFGGEEEKSVQENFPTELRTAETVWLFLQAVMARLRPTPNARCAIVVPNSVLFDQGGGARIKKQLMEDFNLHTVLRLPNGVFAPYTIIPANVLFFERGEQQEDVWFYEHPLPEGRKNYTKTKPLLFDEFAACRQWWGGRERAGREETSQAWSVKAADIAASGYNLDLSNPNRAADAAQRPVKEVLAELVDAEREMLGLLEQLQREVEEFEL